MATASGRTSGQNAASIADEQSPGRQRQRREPGKPTWRCLNRLSLSSAWLAPLNRGSLNSAHIHGTDVPVEEPSTASNPEELRVSKSRPRCAQEQRSRRGVVDRCRKSDAARTSRIAGLPFEQNLNGTPVRNRARGAV